MNKKILIIVVVAMIIVLGVVYFLLKPGAGQKTELNSPNVPTTGAPTSQPSNDAAKANPEVFNITIQNFSFNPPELNIKKGDAVTWTNQDTVSHRILGSSFQSDALSKGQSFSLTFNSTGSFDYICSIHPFMKGKIVVQ
jgi:amicyanin